MTSAGTSSYQERNYLAHLVRACHSRSKVVFVLAAYLDDSGSEGDQPIIAAAGYVAKRTQLPELEKNWRYLLDREGLREPFRMSQAESLHGQFSGWDKRRKDRLVSSLIGVVKLRALCIIGCVISMKDYLNAVSKHDRPRVGGPFSICAGACLLSLSNWIQTSNYYQDELVDVIFEKGTSIANKLVESYMRATSYEVLRTKHKINSILPLPKGSTPLLEPADLVAYEVFKYHLQRITGRARRTRRSLSTLLENGLKCIGTVLERKQIETHVRLMQENGFL
jgi:hypothetical protein